MVKRCKGCNGFGFFELADDKEILDPKKELCNSCFIKIDEFQEKNIKFILDFNVDLSKNNAEELHRYLQSLVNQIRGMTTYSIKILKI